MVSRMSQKKALVSEIHFTNIAKPLGERQGNEWYEWVVYVNEGPGILSQIKAVEYLLHRTFVDPLRRMTDRNSKFALRSSGWGEFDILITVFFADGSRLETTYSLDLSRSWDSTLPVTTPSG